jgi:hypothetical protein
LDLLKDALINARSARIRRLFMQKLLLILSLALSFGAGLYGCADDIDARGSKVDTDTETDTDDDEGAAGASGMGAVDDNECAAACDNDECVAACSD